jgi:hypothetical protein
VVLAGAGAGALAGGTAGAGAGLKAERGGQPRKGWLRGGAAPGAVVMKVGGKSKKMRLEFWAVR